MVELRVVTVSGEAAEAASHWLKHYGNHHPDWRDWLGRSAMETYERLVALGPNPDAMAVNAVIGNNSWTNITCEACQKSVDEAVEFDTRYDDTIRLCRECLEKSLELLKR